MTSLRNILGILFASIAMLAPPAYPSAYDFNGSSSSVTVTQTAAINTQVLSIGCWTRREGVGEGDVTALMSKTDFGTQGWQWGSHETAGRHYFITRHSSPQGFWYIARPSLNTWHHLVVTHDGTSASNIPSMYLNGVSQSVTVEQTPLIAMPAGTQDLVIGDFNGLGGTWDGQLAECFYYDRVLAANEVKSIYNCGPKSVRRQLVDYWLFGVHGPRSYVSGGHTGTAANVTAISNGPPIRYPQGATCD